MPAPRMELAMRATRLHRPTVRTSSGGSALTLFGQRRCAMPGDIPEDVGGMQRFQVRVALAAVIIDPEGLVVLVVFKQQSNGLGGSFAVANGYAQPIGVPLAAVDGHQLHSGSDAG